MGLVVRLAVALALAVYAWWALAPGRRLSDGPIRESWRLFRIQGVLAALFGVLVLISALAEFG